MEHNEGKAQCSVPNICVVSPKQAHKFFKAEVFKNYILEQFVKNDPKVTAKLVELCSLIMRQFIYSPVIRIYGSNIRTKIVPEKKYAVQRYHWDQKLRSEKNRARSLAPSFLAKANKDNTGAKPVNFEYHSL